MSDIIHLLPDNVANQIAAGEVIQRPASVVKELLENAVDANAKKIELHIKDAGKTAIQVIDDGKGMSKLDAKMCFERHATSKVSTAKELFDLHTKGFRGEAMASIAAIAQINMETIDVDSSIGTKIEIKGSEIISTEPCSRQKGTAITVKNLFYNVPARRNFLKSDNVEMKHIVTEFNRIALTHPELSFIFTNNGKILHQLVPAKMRKRIVDLFGENFNSRLVPIEEETEIVAFKGFIVKPEHSRKTRGEQYFFVNQRFFKDNYLNHAVTSGYDNLISSNRFPSYFIHLTVPPNTLDVNIHPTKTEVKFEDKRSIYTLLRSAIKLALGKHNIAPTLDFNYETQYDLTKEDLEKPLKQPTIKVDPTYNPFETTRQQPGTKRGSGYTGKPSPSMRPNREDWEEYYKITEEADFAKAPSLSKELETNDEAFNTTTSNPIQLHKKYLITQVKSGIMIIHINRAKERILYDELMEHFMRSPIATQQLMFPFEHRLQKEQQLEWKNNETHLKRLGFEWEWRDQTIVFSGVPAVLNIENIAECVDGIIEKITYKEIDKGELVHELLLSLSSAATQIKNKILEKEEIDMLINQLFQSKEHQYSPSGKMIMNTISLNDLSNYLC